MSSFVANFGRCSSRSKSFNLYQRRNFSGGRTDGGGNKFTAFRRISATKYVTTIVGAGLLAISYAKYSNNQFGIVQAFTPKKAKDETEKAIKLTSRERRFIKFASAEYDGQLYMTPQDFLDSVVEQEPRRSCVFWDAFAL